jgi:hypothetical protein
MLGALCARGTLGSDCAKQQRSGLSRSLPKSQLDKRIFVRLESPLPTDTLLPSTAQDDRVRHCVEQAFGYLGFPRRSTPVVRADVAQHGSLLEPRRCMQDGFVVARTGDGVVELDGSHGGREGCGRYAGFGP